jgi:hypothetical protein
MAARQQRHDGEFDHVVFAADGAADGAAQIGQLILNGGGHCAIVSIVSIG